MLLSSPSLETRVILNAGLFAGTAYLLNTVSPMTGAIFGVASTLISEVKYELGTKTANFAIRLIVQIGLGVLITTLVGFPITFTAGLVLFGCGLGLLILAWIPFLGLMMISDQFSKIKS